VNTTHAGAISTNGQPSVTYFLGAMLADGVHPALAEKVAHGYTEALNALQPLELLSWRLALLARLNAGTETVFATLAHPSEHEAPRYLAMADTHRQKENGHGDTA
jgi:hypothetical protein